MDEILACQTIRGFNYQPSYEATGYAIWRYFQPETIKVELGRARRYFPGMNTIRAWLSFDAFAVDPDGMASAFEAYLAIAHEHGLRVLPTLFNNWHSIPDFGGIAEEMIRYWFTAHGEHGDATQYVFRPYLERIVGDHRDDPRVLAWDLCNEPFNSGDRTLYLSWLTHTYYFCKTLGAQQPIGVSVGADLDSLTAVDDISDMLMFHPYFATRESLDPLVDFAWNTGKPLLATECCWGAMDDAERGHIVRSELTLLAEYGIGLLPYTLQEGLVADHHRPQLGVVSGAGYMAFIHHDGTLRAHHDAFNAVCP